MDRIAIFVDGSNLYHSLQEKIGRYDVDFEKLSQQLCGSDRKLVRLYYYIAPLDQQHDAQGYAKQLSFLAGMRRTPYTEVRLGRLQRKRLQAPQGFAELAQATLDAEAAQVCQLSDTARNLAKTLVEESISPDLGYYYVEKGVDVRLATDMIHMAYTDSYDTAILVSHDGDYSAAVQAVKDAGRHVQLARVQGCPCYHLQQLCDVEIELTKEFLEGCWLR